MREEALQELSQRPSVDAEELRGHLSRLLNTLREEGKEVVITRKGKPAAVLVDVEKYLEVERALREFADPEYLAQLVEARQEIRRGEGTPAEEVFRRKGV